MTTANQMAADRETTGVRATGRGRPAGRRAIAARRRTAAVLSAVGAATWAVGGVSLPSAHAADIQLANTGDFGDPNTWAGSVVPGPADQADVNNGGAAIISATSSFGTTFNVSEAWAGNTNGFVDGTIAQTGGTLNVGAWLVVGRLNSNGEYDLSGGTVNQTGQRVQLVGISALTDSAVMRVSGTGTLNSSGTAIVVGDGGDRPVASTGGAYGHLYLSDTAKITATGQFIVGLGSKVVSTAGNGLSTGVFDMTSGTLQVAGAVQIGRNDGTGVMTMTGGLLNESGGSRISIIGDAGSPDSGLLRLGGTASIIEPGGAGGFVVGDGDNRGAVGANGHLVVSDTASLSTGTGELWVGQGSAADTGVIDMSGGSITVNNWIAVGRAAATGTVNLTGGTITKTGTAGNHITLGSIGGNGTVNQSGGTLNSTVSDVYVGETGPGVYNLTGGTLNTLLLNLGVGTGGRGTFNMTGGVANVTGFTNGNATAAATLVNLNGGTIRLGANNTSFFGNLAAANISIGSAGLTLDANGFAANVSQGLTITNGGGITLNAAGSAAGSVTFTGANTFTGPVTATGGTLYFTNVAGLGNTSALNLSGGNVGIPSDASVTGKPINFNGGGLILENYASALTFNTTPGNIRLGASLGTPSSLSGQITGTGSLTYVGPGTLNLSNPANTYSGGTNISAGTVNAVAGSLGTGGILLSGTGTLGINSDGAIAGQPLTFAGGGITFNNYASNLSFAPGLRITLGAAAGTPSSLAGVIANNGSNATSVVYIGPGTLALTGNNTYTGGTNASAGTLQLSSANALGTGPLTVSGTGIVDLNGQQVTQQSLTLAGGQVIGSLGTGSLTLTAPPGTPAVIVTGPSYVATTAALSAATVNLSGGAIIKPVGTGTAVITSGLRLGANTVVALADSPGDPAAELSLTGVISGPGGLNLANNAAFAGVGFANQQDFGTLLLSNANTYTGGTNISSGRIVISNATAFGTGPVTIAGTNTVGGIVATGGTLQFGNTLYNTSIASGLIPTGINLANPVNLAGAITGNYGVGILNSQGANTMSGPVALLQPVSVINVGGTSLTLSGNLSNGAGVAGGFTKTGASPLFLSGTNSYTGLVTAGAGEIVPLANAALPAGGATAVTAGADVNVPGNVTVTGSTVTVNGSGVALGGGLTSNAPSGTVGTWAGPVVLGSAGLTAVNARVGAQVGSTLVVAGPISNGTASQLDVSGLGTLNSNASYGSLVLSGVNTYTGLTNVIRGNLIVDGSALTAGQANINNASGITVGASGTAGEFSSLTLRNGAVVRTTATLSVATGNGTFGSVTVNPGTTLTANGIQTGNVVLGSTDTTTFTQTGGTVNALTYFSPGFSGTGNATMNLSGGTVNVRTNAASTVGELEVGVFDQQTTVLNVGAGEAVNLLNNANLVIGSQNNTVANTVNQTGGTVTMFADAGTTVGGTGLFLIGRGSPLGAKTYNLSGGVLTVNGVNRTAAAGTGSGTLNFNGGTLRAANNSGGFIANLTAARVLAGGAILDTQAFNVTVNQNLSSGTATGTLDGGLTKLGTGTLTLGGQLAYTGVTNASAGTITFPAQNAGSGIAVRTLGGGLFVNSGARVVVPTSAATADRTVLVVSAGPVAFNGSTASTTGTIQLGNGDLIVRNGSLANLNAAAARGFDGGSFNSGGGLTSSSAAADSAHLTAIGVIQNTVDGTNPLFTSFDGVAVTATDVLAKYTYFGDANLDGVVNASDFTRLDAGAFKGLTGWINGDFNYDGVVDGSDYALADNAFNQQAGAISPSLAGGGLVASPTALVAGGSAAVPEPASMAVLAVAGSALLAGRRRRHAARR